VPKSHLSASLEKDKKNQPQKIQKMETGEIEEPEDDKRIVNYL